MAAPPRKPEIVPASSASEPSEPSEVKPEDKPREQLTHEQEENPQLVAHQQGRQAVDGKAENGPKRRMGGRSKL